MPRIKICGITRTEDAIFAQQQGAWAVGFIFYEKSPRFITPEKAGEITSCLDASTQKIGVFVNSGINEIIATTDTAGLSMVQLHGDESPQFCFELSKKLDLPIIKVFRVTEISDLDCVQDYKGTISYILLDTYSKKEFGGTGETFNWDIAIKAKDIGIPLILAGGINAYNVNTANKTVQPCAIDISSGVETGKGIKDHNLIHQLFNATG